MESVGAKEERKRMFWIGLVVGLLAGGVSGYVLAALMVANSRRDGRIS